MRLLAEEIGVFPLIVPIDLAGGANAGVQRIDMRQYHHAEVLIFKAVGSAAEPIVVTLTQYTAGTAGSSKALAIAHGVYVKNETAIEDATAFSKEAGDATAGQYTGTSSIEKEAIIAIPIDSEDLDVNNGYHWFSAAIADVGEGAQIGCALVLAFDPHYGPAPDATYHA